jgi:hypothetical protein
MAGFDSTADIILTLFPFGEMGFKDVRRPALLSLESLERLFKEQVPGPPSIKGG